MLKPENTYLFIPGGWQGGWVFDPIKERLEKLGNKCFSLTLPGLETKPVSHNTIINLDTHIQYVIDFVLKESLTDIILCGHSYAGMVITGVADKIPERILSLVYIDAYIPEDGDSCYSLTSDLYKHLFVEGAGEDGYMVAVPQGVETRRTPHPLATFMQNIKLKGDYHRVPYRTFIYLSGWDQSPFKRLYEELKNSEDWHIETVHCAHNIMREDPDKLADILVNLKLGGL